MNKKPLFVTLIVAAAIIGIVAVILFVKNKPVETKPKKGKTGKDMEPEPEPEPENEINEV